MIHARPACARTLSFLFPRKTAHPLGVEFLIMLLNLELYTQMVFFAIAAIVATRLRGLRSPITIMVSGFFWRLSVDIDQRAPGQIVQVVPVDGLVGQLALEVAVGLGADLAVGVVD